jgi:hypothetical protein
MWSGNVHDGSTNAGWPAQGWQTAGWRRQAALPWCFLQEAHTLLSAAAVALSHARISWPLLIPVHDAVRDGHRGVAVGPLSAGAATFRLDADSLHSSRLAPGLLRLDRQLELFARQLAAAAAPAAAAACHAALGAADLEAAPASMAADAVAAGACGDGVQGGRALSLAVAVRHSYALPDLDEEPGEQTPSGFAHILADVPT